MCTLLKDTFLITLTEIELANVRRTKVQDSTEELASTSGSHFPGSNYYDSSTAEISKLRV